MKFTTWTRLEFIGLCLCILAIPALATTVTVGSATLPAVGSSTDIVITGDSFPDGLFGYIMNASFNDPSIAEITAVTFPAWVTWSEQGVLPSTDLRLKVLTFTDHSNSTDLPLVTLTVRGKAAGTTLLNLSVRDMASMTGSSIYPTIVPGTIIVGGVPTTGSLNITSSPTGATVTVDGTTYGTTPAVVSGLSPGSHTLELSLTGYQAYSGTATVTAGVQTPVNVVLTPVSPTTGSLSITSSPSGATVTVDGTGYGTTPVVVSGLSPGSHTIGLSLTGYQAYSGTATVTAGVQTPVNVVLTPVSPTTGSLSITSSPSGATVTVDGTGYGLTPAVVSGLSPGSHTLGLSLTGYQPYSGTASVTAGTQTPVNIILTPVSPTTGSLSITSSPSGATVTVDGTGYGLTPAVVSSLSPGSHTLGLSLTGYQPYSGTASVTAGTQTPVNIILTPVSPTTGSLSITSSPSGATVTVDGTGYGTTPAIVSSLSPGSHTLGLSLTGYQAYSGTATVTAGVQTPVNVVLTPEPVGEPGYLTLFTFPNKAIVTVDGTVIGTSPLMDAAISPGIHTLKVSASGYSEYTTTLEVISDQHKRMPFVILKRTSGGGVPTPTLTTTVTQTPSPGETGGISVKSFPKNAVIFLNNEVKGNTPATIQGLAPGEYELKLVYPRYQTKVKTVTVEAGKITAVPLILMFPDRYTR